MYHYNKYCETLLLSSFRLLLLLLFLISTNKLLLSKHDTKKYRSGLQSFEQTHIIGTNTIRRRNKNNIFYSKTNRSTRHLTGSNARLSCSIDVIFFFYTVNLFCFVLFSIENAQNKLIPLF